MSTPEPEPTAPNIPELPADSKLAALAAEEAQERGEEPDPRLGAYQTESAPAEAEAPAEEQEHLYAGKYKTAEELERAYTEAQSLIGRQGNELGQLKQQVGQPQQQPDQQQFDQNQRQFLEDGTPILTQEELAELRDEDPYTAARLEAKYDLAIERIRLEQEFAQRNEPFLQVMNDLASKNAIDTLRERVGDDLLNTYKSELAQAMETSPQMFADMSTRVPIMEMTIRAAAQRDQQGGSSSQPRQADGRFAPGVHVEGGSGAQPAPTGGQVAMSDEDREIAALKAWKPKSDALGPLPDPY